MSKQVLAWLTLFAAMVCWTRPSSAQLAPTGAHYAGRSSDTGFSGPNEHGGYSATIPLELPPARGGLPIPLQIVSGTRGYGAAGVGWDIPVYFVFVDDSFARRRPAGNAGVKIAPRKRITVSLPGRSVEMLPRGDGFIARSAADVTMKLDDHNAWIVVDGAGTTYTFTHYDQLDNTGGPIPGNDGMWLLTGVRAATGATAELAYDVHETVVSGAVTKSVDLTRVSYNADPSRICFKNEVRLGYGVPAGAPQSLSLVGVVQLARFHPLTSVVVTSRQDCGSAVVRLRSYGLHYAPDQDTQQDRLQSVDVSGREGTPEASQLLPVAFYQYGTATTGTGTARTLRFDHAYTMGTPGGAQVDTGRTSRLNSGDFTAPIASASTSGMFQSLVDFTGDGIPDLVYRAGASLWLATSHGTSFAAGASLNDAVFTSKVLDARSSDAAGRFSLEDADDDSVNTESIWTQTIDVNGDGRLDVVDAAQTADTWVVYLNTPDATPTGIKWVRRTWNVANLHQLLLQRGLATTSPYLPLSRRKSGRNHITYGCYGWNGAAYVPSTGCSTPPPTYVQDEVTLTEYELRDVNGDGYPDVVLDTSLTGMFQTSPIPLDQYAGTILKVIGMRHEVRPAVANQVEAMFNVAGVHFSDAAVQPNVFSSPTFLLDSACGVAKWDGHDSDSPDISQSATCGFIDVNGDGIADRIEQGILLGTGTTFVQTPFSFPPGIGYSVAVQHSDYRHSCKSPYPPTFNAREEYGFRDVTGDGIPDLIVKRDDLTVYIGTGAGFSSTGIKIIGANVLSSTDEDCDGLVSSTHAGIYDVDGDGVAEYVTAGGSSLDVYKLTGASGPGTVDEGRLTHIDNGYGAEITVTYASAKKDVSTPHQVPGPEVVVASVAVAGKKGFGGNLATTYYAYGGIGLFYDSVSDGFRPDGYHRRVEMSTSPGDGNKLGNQIGATITDTYPLAPVTPVNVPFLSEGQRLGRYLLAGRVSDVTVLAGSLTEDAWGLLADNVAADTRRIGGTHLSYDTIDTRWFGDASIPTDDLCKEIMFPYDYQLSLANNYGAFNPCNARGFLVKGGSQAWRGSAAPPSTANVQTATTVRSADDLGRVTSFANLNDLSRSDDDVCIDTTYAAPTSSDAPILTAVASRKVWDCGKNGASIILGEESFEYDKLIPGLVFQGLPTSHTVYRHRTDNGQWLSTIRQYDADFDLSGNPIKVITARDPTTSRTTQVSYDAFGISPIATTVSGTDVPTLQTSQDVDPITEAVLHRTDANGTTVGATFDGFGRVVFETVAPVGEDGGILAQHRYLGFDGTDPLGRRVSVKQFTDPVKAEVVDSEPGRLATSYLDELGRSRFGEVGLGDDYTNERMIVGARSYDLLGRVSFEADPYPASQSSTSAYGTTQYYNSDGSPWVSIRGAGKQLFTTAPNASIEVFPSVVTHTFANHVETMVSQDATSLTTTTPQYGVTHESSQTAVGRTLSAQTRQNGANLEYETFTYDLLGQQTSMTRYQNPVGPGSPVTWSFQLDTLGQTVSMTEPTSAPQQREYSNWGELKSVTYTPPSPEPTHALVSTYDALGRIISSSEQNGGVTDPATLNKYVYDVPVTAPYITPKNVLGRLASARTPTDSVALSYDGYGRVIARSYSDASTSAFVEEQGFHGDGTQAWVQLRLPDALYVPERMDYAYDTAGRLRWMWFSDGTTTQELYNASTLDAWGRLRSGMLGATEFSADFNDLGRRLPKSIKLSSSSGTRGIGYTAFDAVGRELSRSEDTPILPGKEDSTYDALGRLKSTIRRNTTATISQWAFTYDPLGNVTKLDDQVGTADASMTYLSTDRDQICAVSYVGAPGPCNVAHDSFGNITYEPTRTGFNKLSYFNSGDVRRISNLTRSADFTYDAFGGLQDLQINDSGTKVRHDHHYGASITQRSQTGTGGTTTYIARQFSGFGVTVSRRGPAGHWVYEFSESRGTRFTTDETGKFVQDISYTPFGNATSKGVDAGAPEFTTDQWNEGEALEGFGLIAVGKRLYDPAIGRFLSRDPLIAPRSASSTNPYAFSLNEPLNLSDPSGLDPGACNDAGFHFCIGASTSTSGGSDLIAGAAALGAWAAHFYFITGHEPPMPNGGDRLEVLSYSAAFNTNLAQIQVMNHYLGSAKPGGIRGFAHGFGRAFYKAGAGVVQMARHPLRTAGGIASAFKHPIRTAEGIGSAIYATGDAIASGDMDAAGEALGTVATVIAPGKALEALSELSEVAEAVNAAGEVSDASALFEPATLGADIDAAFDTGRVKSGTMIEFSDKGGALQGIGPEARGGNIWYHDNVGVPGAGPGGVDIEIRTHSPNPGTSPANFSHNNYTTQINTVQNNPRYLTPGGSWRTIREMNAAGDEAAIAGSHYPAGN